jgi:hypothetical protein
MSGRHRVNTPDNVNALLQIATEVPDEGVVLCDFLESPRVHKKAKFYVELIITLIQRCNLGLQLSDTWAYQVRGEQGLESDLRKDIQVLRNLLSSFHAKLTYDFSAPANQRLRWSSTDNTDETVAAIEVIMSLSDSGFIDRVIRCEFCNSWLFANYSPDKDKSQRMHQDCRKKFKAALMTIYMRHKRRDPKFDGEGFLKFGKCKAYYLEGCEICQTTVTESISGKTGRAIGLPGSMRKEDEGDEKPKRAHSRKRNTQGRQKLPKRK